ncbi:MAG: hypothetical protein WAK48_09715 [Candidatus Acidiferrum sp.]|jgi:hypothetical protein
MIAFKQAGLAVGEFRLRAKDLRPVLIVILAGDIILRNEEGQAFEAGIISGVEDAPDADKSEVTAHEEQLRCALRIHVLKDGNVLKVSSSHTGARSQALWLP